MESFPFQRLPLELRIKIVREALPSLIVPEYICDPDQPISWAERVWVAKLTESCKDIQSIVKSIRKIVGFDDGRVFFRLDPISDTLLVKQMCLPEIESTKSWDPATFGLDRHALPVRRLMTQSFRIMTPLCDKDYPDWMYRHHPRSFYPDWSEVPFSASLPVFSHLPLVEELVLSIQRAGTEWNIDDFQMFGPEIIAPRRREQGWFGPHDEAAAEYFASRGISADTGEKWISTFAYDMGGSRYDNTSPPSGTRIGFYGFSSGTMSLGGKWAGFRHFTETNEVYFSPLAWSEVQHFVHRWYAPDGRAMNPPGDPQPQLIARVWIIRPGKEAEPARPHHCWLKVKEWEEGDPDWVAQVETMWKMVRGHLLDRRSDNKYRLCVADDA
ncbi:hypothetical protein ACHAPA_008287 [Fusarium lateritium]